MAIECNICCEEYTEDGDHTPKLLPCSHMVCLLCLQRLQGNDNRVTCPECRVVSIVPPGGVEAFPTNRYIFPEQYVQEPRRQDDRAPIVRNPAGVREVQPPLIIIEPPEEDMAEAADARPRGRCDCSCCDECCARCRERCTCECFCSCCKGFWVVVGLIFAHIFGFVFGFPIAVVGVIIVLCASLVFFCKMSCELTENYLNCFCKNHCKEREIMRENCGKMCENLGKTFKHNREQVQSFFVSCKDNVLKLYRCCYGCGMVMEGFYHISVGIVLGFTTLFSFLVATLIYFTLISIIVGLILMCTLVAWIVAVVLYPQKQSWLKSSQSALDLRCTFTKFAEMAWFTLPRTHTHVNHRPLVRRCAVALSLFLIKAKKQKLNLLCTEMSSLRNLVQSSASTRDKKEDAKKSSTEEAGRRGGAGGVHGALGAKL